MVKPEKFDHLHLVYHFTVPLMNYLGKMRVLTLLLTLLGKCKSKRVVKLWLMWENFFLKTMAYVEKYVKKKNYNINVTFYFKQIVGS